MALTAKRVNTNNKSNDRDYYTLEYYYLHDILESRINGGWINGGGGVRKFWKNKWEDWENIENLIAGVGKINRMQWS